MAFGRVKDDDEPVQLAVPASQLPIPPLPRYAGPATDDAADQATAILPAVTAQPADDIAEQTTSILPAVNIHADAITDAIADTAPVSPQWVSYHRRSRLFAKPASQRKMRQAFVTTSCFLLGVIALISSLANGQATLCASPAASRPTITVNANSVNGRVSPLLFGQDFYYPDAGQTIFADTSQTTYDASLLRYVRELNPTIFRCGGGLDSEWYHWVYGIGPLANRVPTKMGRKPTVRVDNFGVDDCLGYVETVGATAIMQVNSNDYPVTSLNPWNPKATPDEAAALVAYVNGSPTDTHVIGVDEHGVDWFTVGYWAQRRAQNGHPAPYKITYFEIGNEDYSFNSQNGIQYGQRFLRYAHAMKAVDPSIKTGAVLFNDEPGYLWNTQVPQTAGSQIDFLIDHDYPMGDISMERFFDPQTVTRTVDFPVEAGKTYAIRLKAISFYQIQANSHMILSIDDNSYSVDIPQGYDNYVSLRFDIPGSQLYQSGRHVITMQFTAIQRYVDIYKDISVNDKSYPLFSEQEIYEYMLKYLGFVDGYLSGLKAQVVAAGLSPSVPIFVTEYNLALSPTTNEATYAASMMTALLLMKYTEHGMGMASMFVLSQPTPEHWNVIATDASDPNNRQHWKNPQAYGFEIVRHHMGQYLVSDAIANNFYLSSGAPALNVIASKDPSTNMLHIIVSNSSYGHNITASLNILHGTPAGAVIRTTLNARSVLSTSTSATDSQIALTTTTLAKMGVSSSQVFPAHSITTFDIPLSPPNSPAPAMPTSPTTPGLSEPALPTVLDDFVC